MNGNGGRYHCIKKKLSPKIALLFKFPRVRRHLKAKRVQNQKKKILRAIDQNFLFILFPQKNTIFWICGQSFLPLLCKTKNRRCTY